MTDNFILGLPTCWRTVSQCDPADLLIISRYAQTKVNACFISYLDFTSALHDLLPSLQSYTVPEDLWSIETFTDPNSTEMVCRKFLQSLDQWKFPSDLSSDNTVVLEYRILFSDAYQVPVLFIRSQDRDGRGLSMESLIYFLNRTEANLHPNFNGLVLGLSPIEHAHLGTPYYQFHPCRTAELMQETTTELSPSDLGVNACFISYLDFTSALHDLLPSLQSYTVPEDLWSIETFTDPNSTEMVCRKFLQSLDQWKFPSDLSSDNTVVLEYRILFSDAYQVPVLFIRSQDRDGRGLSMESLIYFLNRTEANLHPNFNGLVLGLSPVEHAHLGTPYYQFHPCRTAELMQETTTELSPSDLGYNVRYLILWMSLICYPLGLRLPNELLS
ncbi:unnamed protein product [Dicrocoelium dendriticum]|nr:unnamed protein product [Dicrocoelium dendriticum]